MSETRAFFQPTRPAICRTVKIQEMEKLTFYEKQRAKGHAEADGVINGTTIGFRVWSSNGTTDEENEFGRRLVAAYNATRHVPVETLETDPLTLDGVEDTFERLKAINEQALYALEEARLQIEYLHGKFKATGSGNAVLQRINSVLSAYSNQKT